MALEGGGMLALTPLSLQSAKILLNELGYKYNDVRVVEKSTEKLEEKNIMPNNITTKEATIEPRETIKNTTSHEATKLRELYQLYKEGVLTEEEFILKKKELLDKI